MGVTEQPPRFSPKAKRTMPVCDLMVYCQFCFSHLRRAIRNEESDDNIIPLIRAIMHYRVAMMLPPAEGVDR